MANATEWSPWRDRRFLLFASGNFLDNVGSAIYNVALPLLVYDVTKSLALMSLLAAIQPLSFLLAPLFGALADRYGSGVLVVPGLGLQILATLGMNVVALSGLGRDDDRLALTLLMAFSLFVQLGGNAYRRGWMAGIPSMFGENAVRARGSQYTLYIASTIFGPLIVTATLPVFGYERLLWANLFSYMAPMVVWWLGARPPKPALRADGFRFHFYKDLVEGWQIFRRQPQVFNYLLLLLPLTFATSIDALMTYYLRYFWNLSSEYVSAIWGVAHIATFIGSVLASEQRQFRLRLTLSVTVVGMIACAFLLSLPILPVTLAVIVLSALLGGAFGAVDGMLLVKFIPAEAFGRINGIALLLASIPEFISSLVVPLIQGVAGVQATFLVLGITGSFSVFYLFRKWHLWSDDSTPSPTTSPTPTLTNSEKSRKIDAHDWICPNSK